MSEKNQWIWIKHKLKEGYRLLKYKEKVQGNRFCIWDILYFMYTKERVLY